MSRIDVLVWNLQTFGARYGGDTDHIDICLNLTASIIHDIDVEVVLIQELKQAGIPWLRDLINILDALETGPLTWRFDWIGGGITAGNEPTDVAFADMTFDCTNFEGYGVLWRGTYLNYYSDRQLSGGAGNLSVAHRNGNNSFINSCLSGYGVWFSTKKSTKEPLIRRLTPAFTDPDICGYPLACNAAIKRTTHHRKHTYTPQPNVFVKHWSRRPAQVALNTNPAMTVVAFHAMNNKNACRYGPMIMMNAHGYDAKVVYGGDWNTTSKNVRRTLAETAAAYGMDSPLINQDGTLPGHAIGSMVHACGPKKNGPWFGQTLEHPAFTSARDFVMIDANPAPSVEVLQSVIELFYAPANRPGGNPRTATYDFLRANKKLLRDEFSYRADWPTRMNISCYEIVDEFLDCIATYDPNDDDPVSDQLGGNADFSTAFAILFNYFASDHLPILLGVDTVLAEGPERGTVSL